MEAWPFGSSLGAVPQASSIGADLRDIQQLPLLNVALRSSEEDFNRKCG